jgi:hypothetical protein
LSGKWTFPSYSKCCPICKGKHCAIRIGFYFRYAYDSVSGTIILLPIARYLCQRKGKAPKNAHKTFSLLPAQLVPYCLYDIPSLVFMASLYLQGLSLMDITAEFMAKHDVAASPALVAEYIDMFSKARTKANTLDGNKYPDDKDFLAHLMTYTPVREVMNIWDKHKVFLFGTPSQDRY